MPDANSIRITSGAASLTVFAVLRSAIRSTRAGLGTAACLSIAAQVAAAAHSPDSITWRVEIGSAAEVTNEQFYESSIDDTTFLGRRLYSNPETRLAAVALAELTRASSDGRWLLRLSPDALLGEKHVRLGTSASVHSRPGARTRMSLEPRVEYESDERFGLLRRDWRASVVGRVRRLSEDELATLRITAASDLIRVADGSDPFLLSGTTARAAIGYGRTPIFGWEWDLEYGALARVFRDSTLRDHLEHRFGVTFRRDFERGHAIAFDLSGDRRMALRDPESSRDRFIQLRLRAESSLRVGEGWSLRPEFGAETQRYDRPDSLVEFDYGLVAASLELRRDIGLAWRFSVGPRAEWLASPWSPDEEYGDVALVFEVERLSAGGWWSLAPVLGHRAYALAEASVVSASDPIALAPHSNFDYVELTGFVDLPVPGGLRVRSLGTLRAERHSIADHDARSLYFSLDLRRLF